jgi:replicative DNA helicase
MTELLFDRNALLIKLESEKIVISSIFLEPELLKDCILVAENFGEYKHQQLFNVFKKLDEKGLPIELTSVLEEIGMEDVGRIGGITYLSELLAFSFTTASFSYHQELILEYYKKRRILEIAQETVQNVFNQTSNELSQTYNQSMALLEENHVEEDDGHISKVLEDTYEWMSTEHGEITGAETGFTELDELTSGLQRQDLVIIAARPSIGKTAFAVDLCKNYSRKGGPTAIFSQEMKNRLLTLRMISSEGNIDGKVIRNPMNEFEDEDWDKTAQALAQLSKMPMHLFDKTNVDIAFIRRKLRMLKRKYPGEHIVAMIDYLQLMKGDPKLKGNKNLEIGDISKSLKQLARELDCTIIALSQLSRKVEERADKRPMLSDLRESGQIEQDADVIGFLYRDDYYNANSDEVGIMEVNIAKQRNGPIGVVKLAFKKEFSKFINLPKTN